MEDSVARYYFHTTKDGRFRARPKEFYGDRIVELSSRYIPHKPNNYKGIRFVLDRYFSPSFRLYDYWERNTGTASHFTTRDTTVIMYGANEYRLAEVDVLGKKNEEKCERPPRSEIRFNFVDEWEYAQDVTYFNMQRDFDTTRTAVRLDVENTGNLETNENELFSSIEQPNSIKPLLEWGNSSVYNALHDAKELVYSNLIYNEALGKYYLKDYSTYFLVINSLTPAQVLRSVFWRYNFNWAYWVQSIVVKGEYHSDSIPINDTSYLPEPGNLSPEIYSGVMNGLKEFTIRSDERLRKQFDNDAKRWYNENMPRGLDSLYLEGFLTRHYIPTFGNRMIDGFPGELAFHQRMKGTTIEFVNGEEEKGKMNQFRQKPITEIGAKGKFKPNFPNYVACFIPYSDEEKSKVMVPNFARTDKVRYTMLRGYTESKQFYSPDYSKEKPETMNDYRRTLLWVPMAKANADGTATLEFYNGLKTQYVDIDIQGRGSNSIYCNAASVVTREYNAGSGKPLAFMEIWKRLANTKISPELLTKCADIVNKGNIEYAQGNFENAVRIYQCAAKYGYPAAIANIGKCYYDGRGVNVNKKLARKYFEFAAENGNRLALHNLGNIYFDGEIETKNDSVAFEYYIMAANKNYLRAKGMVARFFEEGIYVPRNYNKAMEWYMLAAKEGDAISLYKVGMHQVRQDSINRLNNRELRKSSAIEYMRKSARSGNKDAQKFIIKCFSEGKYLKKSRKQSFEWMRSIAKLGDEDAIMYVAYCYEKGRGTKANHAYAYDYYKHLAEKGNEFAIAKVYEFEQLKFFTPSSPKPPKIK